MTLGQPFVRPGSLPKRIRRRDRHLEPRRLDRPAEAFELADARRRIVRLNGEAAALSRRGLDAVRKRDATTASNGIEQPRQRLAACEREHGVNAVGRKPGRRRPEITPPAIRPRIRPRPAHTNPPAPPPPAALPP